MEDNHYTESITPENSDQGQEKTSPREVGILGIIDVLLVLIAVVLIVTSPNQFFIELDKNIWISEFGDDFDDSVINDNKLTDIDKWCDISLEFMSSYTLGYYKDRKDTFPYTLNKHVSGLEKLPPDMVVFYEGKPGWNQVGDGQTASGLDKIIVYLSSGKVRNYYKHQIPYLKWRPDDEGEIPGMNIKMPFIKSCLPVLVIIAVILSAYNRYLKIFWKLALFLAVLSACVGFILGEMSALYYEVFSINEVYNGWLGAGIGFVIAVAYISLVGRAYVKKYHAGGFPGYAAFAGAIAGVVASSIVHGYLMLVFREKSFLYMLGGAGFGIMAGLILGWMTSGFIRFYRNSPDVLGNLIEENVK